MYYLATGDIIAVTIALTLSLVLIVSTIFRNIQLTHQRDLYRTAYQKQFNEIVLERQERSFINGSEFQNYPVIDWKE
jgi:hypothetical protein